MPQDARHTVMRFAIAVTLGVMLGAVIGSGMRAGRGPVEGPAAAPGAAAPAPPVDSAAWRYAQALVNEDWATAAGLTLWMQERLRRVQAETGSAESAAQESARLMETLAARNVADNRLLPEGVEDPYVFAPGAALRFDGEDAGRADLERDTAERLWIAVEYPSRERALRDASGLPIRGLRAGVNVSADGFVLKASATGNVEVDMESLRYDWPGEPEGES